MVYCLHQVLAFIDIHEIYISIGTSITHSQLFGAGLIYLPANWGSAIRTHLAAQEEF